MEQLDFVTIEAFGHTFEDLLPGNAENLRTLEKEGAIYSEFADRDAEGKFLGTFTRYRVKFEPSEIFEFVEAHIAEQEFLKALKRTQDFTAAVLAITNPKYRTRVTEYGNFGKTRLADGSTDDIRGCSASFLGPELEALVCGARQHRYERMPQLGSQANRDELVISALKSIAVSARRLASRSHGRAPLLVENEYDVQDLAETALRSVFVDLVREEWTPKRAGSAKRIDLVIPSIGAVIECKYVRDNSHAREVADELRIDIECYHDYPGCRQLYAFIFDPSKRIQDPEAFTRDLDGLRRKRDHEFTVAVLIS